MEQKKWSLVILDRWSFCKVMLIWELAWADSGLVVLDEWLSYRGGCLSRFDYIFFIKGDRVGKPDTVIV